MPAVFEVILMPCTPEYQRAWRRRNGPTPCACGCGGDSATGQYISGHNLRDLTPAQIKARNVKPKGRDFGGKGYKKYGQVHEHRLVAEKMIRRKLKSNEVVHHKNGDRRDNRPENLEVMDRGRHISLHLTGKPSNRWKRREVLT